MGSKSRLVMAGLENSRLCLNPETSASRPSFDCPGTLTKSVSGSQQWISGGRGVDYFTSHKRGVRCIKFTSCDQRPSNSAWKWRITNRHQRKASKVREKRLDGVLSLAFTRAETCIYIHTIRTADASEEKGGLRHHLEIIPLPQGPATEDFGRAPLINSMDEPPWYEPQISAETQFQDDESMSSGSQYQISTGGWSHGGSTLDSQAWPPMQVPGYYQTSCFVFTQPSETVEQSRMPALQPWSQDLNGSPAPYLYNPNLSTQGTFGPSPRSYLFPEHTIDCE
jgi:hypothetical protein